MYNKYCSLLCSCMLFRDIHIEDIETFLNCLKPIIKEYKKGQSIAHQGDEIIGVGVVLSGAVAITRTNAAGSTVSLATILPSDIFAEVAAFSRPAVYPCDVTAIEACEVIFIGQCVFNNTCEKNCINHTQIIANMLSCLADKARHLNHRLEYLMLKSPAQKTAMFLLEQSRINQSDMFMLPQNRDKTAEFLNLPRPSFSRELCRMREVGIIDFDKNAVKILNTRQLSNILN